MNKLIISKVIDSIIKPFQQNLKLYGSTGEFHQAGKEAQCQSFSNLPTI
jgi:hypothetical protein